jgi:hypothetical protein
VGGVSIELSSDSSVDLCPGDLRQFDSEIVNADIEINIRRVDKLCAQNSFKLFESGATWRLFKPNKEYIFEFTSPVIGPQPYKQMRVDESFRCAEIILSQAALANFPQVSALEYPVCELLITNHLACHGLGIEVHGCGLIDSETGGHLFLGHSGAGKSTTARLWETFRAPKILSDDRIILRFHDGEVWMYGTPWHGEAAFALSGSAKLNRIHILQHGSENHFSELAPAKAVAEIFARSFPPFHSSAGVSRMVEFLNQVVNAVPCYQFNFLPDSSSIEAVFGCTILNRMNLHDS